jgi:hypothetical protein
MCSIYMLQNATISALKNAEIYYCDTCSFQCSKKSNYDKHLLTRKHKNATSMLHNATSNDDYGAKTSSGIKKCQKNAKRESVCDCGKIFNHRSSLWRHKKNCLINVGENIEGSSDIVELCKEYQKNDTQKTDFKDLVILLLKENKEIQKSFLDIIPQIKGNNTNSNNNINNTTNNLNNNHFNINMFLNEQCKNAMNLTDFINSLPITNETYDNTIENGLTKTITSMVVNGLNNMDVLDRPIHCTDPSRKTMYVKDNDIWEKDNEMILLLRGIKDLSVKQRTMINKWQDANYGWNIDEDLQSKMTKLIFHSMTNVEDDQKETRKIIRAISKNTYLSNDVKDNYINIK